MVEQQTAERSLEPGRVARPTSHVDLSNSLLELLGADPARRGDYSLGHSLFAPLESRPRVVGAWAHLGVLTDSGIFQLPLELGKEEVWVFDRHWKPMMDVNERLDSEREVLERTADECTRFLAVDS